MRYVDCGVMMLYVLQPRAAVEVGNLDLLQVCRYNRALLYGGAQCTLVNVTQTATAGDTTQALQLQVN